jgi:PAS domain S-box-containing protein
MLQDSNSDIFKFIVEAAPNALILTDENGKIVFFNRFAENLFQYSSKEIVGKEIETLIPERYRHAHTAHIQNYMKNPEKREMGAGRDLYAIKKDRSEFPAEVGLSPLEIEGNQYVLAAITDITQRKISEKALRDSEYRLDVFFKQSLEGFFFMMLDKPIKWDAATDKEKMLDYVFEHMRITRINDAMLKQYRAKHDDFIGLTPKDFFKHDIKHGREVWKTLFDKGQIHIDTQEKKLDGTPMTILGDYACLYDEKGYITGHFGIQREITKERQAEKELKHNEHKLQTVFDTLDVGITVTDKAGNIIDCNRASEKILGITKNQHLSKIYDSEDWVLIKPDSSIMPPEEFPSVRALKTKRSVREVETGLVKADNSVTWLSVNASPIDIEGYGVLVTYIDISESKLAQMEYQTIISTTQDGFFTADDAGNITDANEAYCKMSGYSREELLTLAIPDIEGSEKPEEVAAHIQKVFDEGHDFFETKHRRKDNTLIDIEISVTVIKGEEIKLIVFVRDITERKEALRKIQESEEKFRQISENVSEVFWLRSADNKEVLYINSAYEKIWGRSCESLYKNPQSFTDAVHEEDKALVYDEFKNYMNGQKFDLEYRIVRPDGLIRYVHARNFRITNEKGELIRDTGIAVDITDRKKVESLLKDYNSKLKRKNKAINQSIKYAKKIQFSILPETESIKKHISDFFLYFKPKDIIGGDFYWFYHKNEFSYIAAVDCTGHSVPGAMMSLIVHSLLTEIMNDHNAIDTGEILRQLHYDLYTYLQQEKGDEYSQDGCDISLCRINHKKNRMQFSGARQKLYIYGENGLEIIDSSARSIGGFSLTVEPELERTFKTVDLPVKESQMFAMTTDGLLDQLNQKDEVFGMRRFEEMLAILSKNKLGKNEQSLANTIENWKKDVPQQDDMLLLAFRINN